MKKKQLFIYSIFIMSVATSLFSEQLFSGFERLRDGIFAKGYGYQVAIESKNSDDTPWNLMLVNRQNPIEEDMDIKLVSLGSGETVDARILPELQVMFDAARSEGVFLVVTSGYRTMKMQQKIMDEKIQSFRDEGMTKREATKQAENWVAIPGTSEHQLGIGMDINGDKINSSNEMVYQWLQKNSYHYGFILRYPAEKTSITGINYEPWHFRYVGKKVATEMYNQGLCLEEYVASI
ncbi:MAG: M15 family metallopeptidase [Bacilli bacterium]